MDTIPFALSDSYIDDLVALSPIAATHFGLPGSDHLWDDLSPVGVAAFHQLSTRYQQSLAQQLDHPDPVQRHAARVLHDYLQTQIESYEAGDHLSNISHLVDPFYMVKSVFEVMPSQTDQDWDNLIRRLETIGQPLSGYMATLDAGRKQGQFAQRRQVESVRDQARDLATDQGFFTVLEQKAEEQGRDNPEFRQAMEQARASVNSYADYLEQTYLPQADPKDGSGEERYRRGVEAMLGIDLDLEETYQWGWEEIGRLRSEMKRVGTQIEPGNTIEQIRQLLDNDPTRAVDSPEKFVSFVEELQRQAVQDLAGNHFEVGEEIRKVSVNLLPPGTPPIAHYRPPSEDFSRPGGIWYGIDNPDQIPLYQEVSTAYHEGFPGHHLQVGASMLVRERLGRAHRLLVWYPGYGEGWALYAERLMEEFGYLDKPDYLFGMLVSHVFRAARVVVDIGLHLGLEIPPGAPGSVEGRWDYDRAVSFMTEVGMQSGAVAASEVKRYLGWPGQAISYKIGEREILRLRAESQSKQGETWDAKEFHRRLLNNGPVRLDYLPEVLELNPVGD